MAYSPDLKQRVLEHVRQHGNKTQAARLFSVSRETIHQWLRQGPDHVPGKPGPVTSRCIDRQELAALVAAQPDLMIDEIAAILGAKRSTVHGNLKKLGLRRKKNTAIRPGLQPQRL